MGGRVVDLPSAAKSKEPRGLEIQFQRANDKRSSIGDGSSCLLTEVDSSEENRARFSSVASPLSFYCCGHQIHATHRC